MCSIHIDVNIHIDVCVVYICTHICVVYRIHKTPSLVSFTTRCFSQHETSCSQQRTTVGLIHNTTLGETRHQISSCSRQVDRKKPPSGGGVPIYHVPWSRTRRKRTRVLFTTFPDQEPGKRGTSLKNHPQNASIWGVLFLRVLDLETTQQRNPPRGGGFFRSESRVIQKTQSLVLFTRVKRKELKTFARRRVPCCVHTYRCMCSIPHSQDAKSLVVSSFFHGWRGKSLQHLQDATQRAFSFLYIFCDLDSRQRFPLDILKLGFSPEIPAQIDWNLKIQKTPILCIEVSSKPSPLDPWIYV